MTLNSNENNDLKDLEEMEDDLEFNEVQEIIQSNVIQFNNNKTGRKVYEVPEHLNPDLSPKERKELEYNFKYNHSDKDNPYRKDSSVDISKELNDFRMIGTDVLKELIKSELSGSEFRVLLYIFHRTRGYQKHVVKISIKDIQEYTEISKPNIYKTLTSLNSKHILYGEKKDNHYELGFNLRYDRWEKK